MGGGQDGRPTYLNKRQKRTRRRSRQKLQHKSQGMQRAAPCADEERVEIETGPAPESVESEERELEAEGPC